MDLVGSWSSEIAVSNVDTAALATTLDRFAEVAEKVEGFRRLGSDVSEDKVCIMPAIVR